MTISRHLRRVDHEMPKAPKGPEPWTIEFLKEEPNEAGEKGDVPARRFLDSIPPKVAARMVAVLRSVAEAPPPQYSGGGYWKAMHADMAGIYEICVDGQPKRTHYRLFCLLERDGAKVGLEGPTIVVITGMKKPFQSVLSERDYARVRALADDFRARTPRLVAE